MNEPTSESPIDVSCRSISLSGGREVLLGTDPSGKYDGLFIRFRSPQAGDTHLRLSDEAMAALMQLYAVHLRDKAHEQSAITWNVQINTADIRFVASRDAKHERSEEA